MQAQDQEDTPFAAKRPGTEAKVIDTDSIVYPESILFLFVLDDALLLSQISIIVFELLIIFILFLHGLCLYSLLQIGQ